MSVCNYHLIRFLTLHLILFVHRKFPFSGWCCAITFHTLLLWRWRFCSLEWCFRLVGSCGGLPVLFSPLVLAAGQFWAFPAPPQIFYCIPVESLLASLVSPSPLTPDGLKSGQVLFHGLLGAYSSCTSSWVFGIFFSILSIALQTVEFLYQRWFHIDPMTPNYINVDRVAIFFFYFHIWVLQGMNQCRINH